MFPDLTERQTNCGGVMGLRTIMIFPDFENGEIIDKIREKYDPLAKMVRPHITIVFPFDIQLSDEEIEKILDNRLNGIKAFEIEFQGFSKCEDKFGNYLFLEVVRGSDIIEDIHDTLYENEFKKLDLELPYTPHMTVGKLSSVDELNNAYEEIKDISCSFSSLIEKRKAKKEDK